MMNFFVKNRLLPTNRIPYRPERTEQLAEPSWWHSYMEPLILREPHSGAASIQPVGSSSSSRQSPQVSPGSRRLSSASSTVRRYLNCRSVRWKTEQQDSTDIDLQEGDALVPQLHRQLSLKDGTRKTAGSRGGARSSTIEQQVDEMSRRPRRVAEGRRYLPQQHD